jgi:hypothetical protein
MEIISLTDRLDPTDDIQPAVPLRQACPFALMIGDGLRIDFRRICIAAGQINLDRAIPPNSFRSIAAMLVGGSGEAWQAISRVEWRFRVIASRDR